MKRNKIIEINRYDRLQQQHQQSLAFHEAGHAAAIYLNNKARNLPPVNFQIVFNELDGAIDDAPQTYQTPHDDSIARVEGGRLIRSLPCPVDDAAQRTTQGDDAAPPEVDILKAFEADIVNLLVGPLAEAKQAYNRDGEEFNRKLVDLTALNNYGGRSDLELVGEYLLSFSESERQRDEKLQELFAEASNFVVDSSNWMAISKLAHYLLGSNQKVFRFEEIASVLEPIVNGERSQNAHCCSPSCAILNLCRDGNRTGVSSQPL